MAPVAHAVYQFANVSGNSGLSTVVPIDQALRQAMQEAGIPQPQPVAIKTAGTVVPSKKQYLTRLILPGISRYGKRIY